MYTVDETIVQQTLRVLNAYPSKGLNEICDDLNHYFSKEVMNNRIDSLCESMVGGDKSLIKYYPFMLLIPMVNPDSFGSPTKLKFVFDKDQNSLINFYKEFCLEFGIPSYLKKHGSSEKRIFKVIDYPESSLLSDVWLLTRHPVCGWEELAKFAIKYMCKENKKNSKFIELPHDKPKKFCVKLASEIAALNLGGVSDVDLHKWTIYLH